jgi:hypothetical protein
MSLHAACEQLGRTRVAHLIVDGYSTDDTLNIVERLSPSSIVVQREKNGIYDALNYGVSLVQSPFIVYLHSDDELDPGFLAEMVKVLDKHAWREEILPYGTVDRINEESRFLFSRRPPVYIDIIQKHVSLIVHPNAIYPTHLEKKYPYSTTSGLTADTNHVTEIAKKLKLIRVPQAIYRFRLSRWSSTVIKKKAKRTIYRRILSRLYLQLFFETNLVERLIIKIFAGRSHWIR